MTNYTFEIFFKTVIQECPTDLTIDHALKSLSAFENSSLFWTPELETFVHDHGVKKTIYN